MPATAQLRYRSQADFCDALKAGANRQIESKVRRICCSSARHRLAGKCQMPVAFRLAVQQADRRALPRRIAGRDQRFVKAAVVRVPFAHLAVVVEPFFAVVCGQALLLLE